jgi:hypothetical protein
MNTLLKVPVNSTRAVSEGFMPMAEMRTVLAGELGYQTLKRRVSGAFPEIEAEALVVVW